MPGSLTSCLFCAARQSATGPSICHRRVAHPIRNFMIGRAMTRGGRRLWGRW